MIPPNSVIEKWLHHDNKFTISELASLLGVEPSWYKLAIRAPWDHVTPAMMEKMAVLLYRPLPEVFWACWMRPEHMTTSTAKLEAIAALNKMGVK